MLTLTFLRRALAGLCLSCAGRAAAASGLPAGRQQPAAPSSPSSWNPSTVIWRAEPAEKWDDALPVGNGRLGAMVFGNTGEERIQINEDTYWSGGPYSTAVRGGSEALPEIRKLIFDGDLTGPIASSGATDGAYCFR